MNSYFDKVDQHISFKILSQPPEAFAAGLLTEEERARYVQGDGLALRLRSSWEVEESAHRAVVAIQTVSDLNKLVPRMVDAFEKLVAIEERRANREATQFNAIWGKGGLILGAGGLIGSLITALIQSYLISGAPTP